MIKLKDRQEVASGQDRVVYIHPENPAKCIKIPRVVPEKGEYRVSNFWEWLFLASRCFDRRYLNYNFVDQQYYRHLSRRNDPAVYRHIPRCYGSVETDLGTGLVFDYIRNEGGGICQSLKEYTDAIDRTGDRQLKDALEDFMKWQLQQAVLLREMAYINTLVQKRLDGSIKIYHIDAVGCVDLVPLAIYAKWFARIRIKSKIFRLRQRLRQRIKDI